MIKVKDNIYSCALLSIYHNDKFDWVQKAIESVDMGVVDTVYIGLDGPVSSDILSYLSKLDKHSFRIISFEKNRGLAHVLNDLIDCALRFSPKYDFFFRIDADDINLEHRFKKQCEFLISNPEIDVLGGAAIIVDQYEVEVGRIYKSLDQDNMTKKFPYKSLFIHPTVVFRRSVLEETRYPTNTIRFEDVALWADLILKNKKFANLSNPLIKYRITDEIAARRSGFKKSFDELIVRLVFLKRAKKLFSINSFFVLTIFFSKLLLPKYILIKLLKIRDSRA
jgi:hypothetical protein